MKNLVLVFILVLASVGTPLADGRARESEEEIDPLLNAAYKKKIVDDVEMTDYGEGIFTSSDTVEPAPCVFDEGEETADGSKMDEVALNDTEIGILDESKLSDAVHCLDGKKDGISAESPVQEGLGGQRRRKRNIRKPIDRYRWPSKTINFQYSRNMSSFQLRIMKQAIQEYSRYTCINFRQITNSQKPFIRIIDAGGCWSYVGHISSFANSNTGQRISLANGCLYSKRIPIHEFFHALGAFHQQSRPDRDQYVNLDLSNVASNRLGNFRKYTNAQVELFGTPYSYRSVMHYRNGAFGAVITPKKPFSGSLGRGPTFSFEDLYIINTFYRCDSSCRGPNTCRTSTRLAYRGKDCKCYCDNDDKDVNTPAVVCPNTTPPPPPKCPRPYSICGCTTTNGACKHLKNTYCRRLSGGRGQCRCVRGSRYFRGACIRPTTCRAVGRRCECQVQRSTACRRIANSGCNYNTRACQCLPDFRLSRGRCVRTRSGYSTDGSAISPFRSSSLSTRFRERSVGNAPNTFGGFRNNGYTLFAFGGPTHSAGIQPPLTLGRGNWCVHFTANLNDAAITVDWSYNNFRTYRYRGIYNAGRTTRWHLRRYRFRTSSSAFNLRIRAFMPSVIAKRGARSWLVRLDNARIYSC